MSTPVSVGASGKQALRQEYKGLIGGKPVRERRGRDSDMMGI